MLLNTILSELQWTPYGIQCRTPDEASLVNLFLREAILDRHIYVSKVIGFAIKTNNTFRPYAGTYIARHKQIGDSYPEIVVNMSDKIFLNTNLNSVETILHAGENTMETNTFGDLRDVTVKVLYQNNRICRCLDKDTVFKARLVCDCGYSDMAKNSKLLGSEYFPCNVDYFIGDYFRILPPSPGNTIVQLRYYHGATEQDLKDILTKWLVFIETGSLKGEETLWLQNFGH